MWHSLAIACSVYNPDFVQLTIDKLIYGGDGLARLPPDERGPGKNVFLPFVLPGETVEASLVEEKPGFARARVEAIVEASLQRTAPGCPYFQRCGGCNYQHASYATQLEIKAAVLRETLKRTGKIDLRCELQIHASPQWNYRNRTRMKVQTAPQFALGYYRFRSHDLLAVEQCPISSPLINHGIAALWDAGRAKGFSLPLQEIEFFANAGDDELLLEASCPPGTPRKGARQLGELLGQILPQIKGVVVSEPERPGSATEAKVLWQFGDSQLKYKTQLFTYQVSAGSFFQVNRFMIDELVELVTNSVSGKLALDLYAGVGLFSAPLSRSFAQVVAVESSQTSCSDLRQNTGPEVNAVRATTDQYLSRKSGERPDFVVADPPRSGLGENVVRNLARLGSPRIACVSCDPPTLARDLRSFVGLGYQIEGAHLVDLFPQTYHIESVFHLAR